MASMFARSGECDEAMKEITQTVLYGSIHQGARLIEHALRAGYEQSPSRPEIGTERAQHGEPRVLTQDRAEAAGRSPYERDRLAAEDARNVCWWPR